MSAGIISSSSSPLRRSLLLLFTLPTLVLGFMHGPEGQIQSVYAKHAALPLAALAAAMLASKIFDAITYPLIGYLCDRSYARSGSRKTWVAAGALVSVIGVWFLQRPPANVGVIYFGIWTAVTYVGWKLTEIPLLAWSYGLSHDYAQRSRVQAWRALALLIGQLLFFATPYLAVALHQLDVPELDFHALGVAALICAIALPVVTLLAVLRVPDGEGEPPALNKRYRLSDTFDAVRRNGPLMQLFAAFLPVNLMGGMSAGVAYLYMDTYLGLGAQFPAIMMVALLATVSGVPFWSALASRFERHRVWAVSLVIGGLACAAFAAVSPGPQALLLSFVLFPVIAFNLVGAVIVFTMSADVVDYGLFVTGEDHSGLYASLFQFLQKSLMGVSAAAGLALIGFLGFDAAASVQSTGGVFGIKLATTIVPAVGLIGGAMIIWNYPLTRARMMDITGQLKARTAAKDNLG